MRTETDEIRDNLKYLTLLARDYPSQAAAASEIISTQALLKLPKGTEHFMSDLHGENEAFVHILNSASGVIREKVDAVLGDTMPEAARAELATLIYYPTEKLPQLKARCTTEDALEQWYTQTLLQLIDICRLVSSKHTRDHVRGCLPPAAAIFWTSCSMPTLRITIKTCTTARSWAASSRTAAPTALSCGCASSSSIWRWISCISWATCLTAAPARTLFWIC